MEAQRDFHMAKIRNLVKMTSRHLHTTTDAYIRTSTAVAVKAAPDKEAAVPVTDAVTAAPPVTVTTVRVLVAGKMFQSRPVTVVAVTTAQPPVTAAVTPISDAETAAAEVTTTITAAAIPASPPMPLRECQTYFENYDRNDGVVSRDVFRGGPRGIGLRAEKF